MKKSLFRVFAAVLLCGSVVAWAADDPREERQKLMSDVGAAMKPVGDMLRGRQDFDAAVMQESLSTLHDVSMTVGDLFPEGSETGMETEAAPAIWEDMEGFEAELIKWQQAIAEAMEADPQSLDAARPVAGKVFNSCRSCHDKYRIEAD